MDQSSNQPYNPIVSITIIVLNVVSLISLGFVLGIYIANWKKIASFPMRLSFYLCFACAMQNLYVLLLNPVLINRIEGNKQEEANISGYCKFQAFLKVSFDLSSIIWTSLIIYSVHASVVRKVVLDSNEYIYLVIAFVIPIIAATIPIFLNLYGFVTYYCWFVSPNDPHTVFWLKMGYFYIPLWLLFLLNLFLAIHTYHQLKRIQLQKRLLTIFKRLMLFPLIMFITGVFSTADLIYYEVKGKYLVWLDVVGIVFLSLYGFFNSVVTLFLVQAYGFNPLIRERIQMVFRGRSRGSQSQSLDQSRMEDDRTETSRDSARIQAQLHSIRTMTRPMILSPPNN